MSGDSGNLTGEGPRAGQKGCDAWPLGLLAEQRLCASSVVYCYSTVSLGLCPDWEAWDPNQPVQNAREAMQQADDWLGVPQVHWQMA